MLKTSERIGLRTLLNTLDLTDLHSVRDTITKKMLTSTNREDTIEAILSCIKEPCDLLNRQKISRKILFNYLRGFVDYVSPDSSKSHLIVKCLEEWNKDDDVCQEMECIENAIEVNPQACQIVNNEQMALAFTKWFFPLYNELHDFDITHFWPDITLEFMTNTGPQKIVGDKEVVNFMRSLIIDQKLYFYPNDSISSLKCEHEIHGMVRITVNGIIYRFDNSAGIFETRFGLVKNPAYNNNWKIKWLCLCVNVS